MARKIIDIGQTKTPFTDGLVELGKGANIIFRESDGYDLYELQVKFLNSGFETLWSIAKGEMTVMHE